MFTLPIEACGRLQRKQQPSRSERVASSRFAKGVFREYKYQLPDHEVKEFIVGREMVLGPGKKLQELLDNPTLYHGKVLEFQLGKVEQEFGGKYGIDIKFTPEAARLITEKAEGMGTDLFTYCAGLFQDYEHGLNLLRKTSSKKQFVIDEDGIRNPEETVEALD